MNPDYKQKIIDEFGLAYISGGARLVSGSDIASFLLGMYEGVDTAKEIIDAALQLPKSIRDEYNDSLFLFRSESEVAAVHFAYEALKREAEESGVVVPDAINQVIRTYIHEGGVSLGIYRTLSDYDGKYSAIAEALKPNVLGTNHSQNAAEDGGLDSILSLSSSLGHESPDRNEPGSSLHGISLTEPVVDKRESTDAILSPFVQMQRRKRYYLAAAAVFALTSLGIVTYSTLNNSGVTVQEHAKPAAALHEKSVPLNLSKKEMPSSKPVKPSPYSHKKVVHKPNSTHANPKRVHKSRHPKPSHTGASKTKKAMKPTKSQRLPRMKHHPKPPVKHEPKRKSILPMPF